MIIERETFPRCHIGGSMPGECSAMVRLLGLEQEMLARWFREAWAHRLRDERPEPQWTWQVRRKDRMLDAAVESGRR